MDIIPVLDILNNKVVKAIKGDRAKYKSIDSRLYNSTEPIEIIKQLSKRYVPHILYIADLDAISHDKVCLLYTSPSPRDGLLSRMPSSA